MTPGIIIAGPHSGVGKTTVTLGIMSILVQAGFIVQGFKVGPDYIDPSFHRGITGRNSENLDSWMTSPDDVKRIYIEATQGAQLAVIEGVMGLFDGSIDKEAIGSTAHIAKILGLPVLLVVDARSMAQSIAPLIKGFTEFDREIQFGGIIVNRVGSEKHLKILTDSIKNVTDIQILGFLSNDNLNSLPERHLGLVPFYENPEFELKIKNFTEFFRKTLDLDSLLNVFRNPSGNDKNLFSKNVSKSFTKTSLFNNVRIGIAFDEAFGFYYQDNLRLLERVGVELVYFSPLHDIKLPDDLDGIYIGGGYPEIFADQLATNDLFQKELKMAILEGIPTYAECGGLMYLTKGIRKGDGWFPMLGLIDTEVEMMPRRQNLGYIEVEAVEDNLLFGKGQKARGHEFHYSKIVNAHISENAYLIHKDGLFRQEGYAIDNILTSYVHLHFASNPVLVKNFIEKCLNYHEIRD